MIKHNVRCKKCHQEGDDRAFSGCHKSVKAIHRLEPQHTGYLVSCHGPRDNKDKHINRCKIAARVIGTTTAIASTAIAGTATILSGAVTIAVPNPATAALTAHLGIATGALAAAATGTLPFAEGARINATAPPLRCAITNAKLRKQDMKAVGNIARRGICLSCNKDVATAKPCYLVWSCCNDRHENSANHHPDLGYGFGLPCTLACKESCKLSSEGCIQECTECGQRSDRQEAFKRMGCILGPHDLVGIA
jgi:hypothetical protein